MNQQNNTVEDEEIEREAQSRMSKFGEDEHTARSKAMFDVSTKAKRFSEQTGVTYDDALARM